MASPKRRIPPLPREEWTDEARDVFAYWGEPDAWENGSKVEKEMVMAQHPKLAMAFNGFGKQLLLETLDVSSRLQVLSEHLQNQIDGIRLRQDLQGDLPDDEIALN